MSVWKFKQDPKDNQYCEGIDLQEGQTTASVPSSLRLLMKQMEEYAKVQRILELSGEGERLTLPYEVPPQEFICKIPAPAKGATDNIVFVLSDGTEVKTEYAREAYDGHYTIRFPEGEIILASQESIGVTLPKGAICHFWGVVPEGWTDITDKYSGFYIAGSTPSERIGVTFKDSFKKHTHYGGMSSDKKEGKTVEWTFQSPFFGGPSVRVEYGSTVPGSSLWDRGSHTHILDVGYTGSFSTNCPPHITLRLGEKL